MPKITKDDITGPTGLGLIRELFSAIAKDDTAFDAFVDSIITDQSAELQDRIGSAAYNLSANATYVKKAEKCLTAAEMVRRRINIVLGNAQAAGQEISTRNEEKQRDEYLSQAEVQISKLAQGVTTDQPDFSCGAVVTSHFGN